MNLYQFISTVKQIALAHKDVNTFNEGDVYEIMNSGQHTYPATVLTINNITTNEQSHYQTINCVLFYIDRLTDDNSNKTMIMSQGFNVLKQIKDKTVESLPWSFETANYTPYTEKFGDLCAGVYLECTIELEDDVICSDTSYVSQQLDVTRNGLYSTIGYDSVLVSVNKPVLQHIDITANGTYTPDKDTDGFDSVNVNVPDPELEELNVTKNGTYTPTKYGYSKVDVNVPATPTQEKEINIEKNNQTLEVLPDEGYDLSKVSVGVHIPQEYPTISINQNGSTKITPTGTDALIKSAVVNVNVPSKPEQTKSVTINQNGTTSVLPDEGSVLSKVDVTVNVAGGGGAAVFHGRNPRFSVIEGDFPTNVEFPDLNSCKSMFEVCIALTSVPLLDTSNVTDMSYMFNYCDKLTTVPSFNTSNVTDMSCMFRNCSSLTTVPSFNTSNVTNMRSMFHNCISLTSVPLFDTSNVTDMSYMLGYCTRLKTIPQFDTSNVTSMAGLFVGCSSLTTIPQLDASKVTNIEDIFYKYYSLTNFGGLLNIGQAFTSKSLYDLSNCSKLTDESIQNVIDGLYDMTAKGFSPTLKFYSTVFVKLTDAQKAQITAKNWTVTA